MRVGRRVKAKDGGRRGDDLPHLLEQGWGL